MSSRIRPLIVATLLAFVAVQAGAGDLGAFGDWFGEFHDEEGGPVCSMWSSPLKQEGDYAKRGSVFVFVTHRPASRRLGEVFIETGYDYRKDSAVKVAIGGYRFELLTSGSTAWALNEAEQRKLVAAMRAGAEMVVEGVSSRATETRDTYSLRGFSAGLKAISGACAVN